VATNPDYPQVHTASHFHRVRLSQNQLHVEVVGSYCCTKASCTSLTTRGAESVLHLLRGAKYQEGGECTAPVEGGLNTRRAESVLHLLRGAKYQEGGECTAPVEGG
jgi:hypothetical protein